VESHSLIQKQFPGRASALLPFLQDDSITDILINGPGQLFVERNGLLAREVSPFLERDSLSDLVERMLVPIGKRVDAAHPYADGRLLDGSRFHIILPPIAAEGPFISIRKQKGSGVTLESFGEASPVAFVRSELLAEKNILIAGATGSGKTTFLSRLIDAVPDRERIAIVEETREIRTLHPHSLSLEARPPTPDGVGEVTLRTLVKNTLRMRPDRIVVGEVRGEEAFDLLLAMNTGHRGTMGTIHANSALDALKRLESLAILVGYHIPLKVIREWVASSIQLVVFLHRREGRREIAEILSVQGLEGEVYRITPRYRTPCNYSRSMQN
jgi:pilus assembly protein CpaF